MLCLVLYLQSNKTPEMALIREIMEELEYTPKNDFLLGIVHTKDCTIHCFAEEVQKGFEKEIVINEGKGGEWHKTTEVINRDDLNPNIVDMISLIESNHMK